MKTRLFASLLLAASLSAVHAAENIITSPDGRLSVTVADNGGRLTYAVSYDGQQVLTPSALGLQTSIGDFTQGLTFKTIQQTDVDRTYEMTRTKASTARFLARQADITYTNAKGLPLTVTFCVANNDIAYRYSLQPLPKDERLSVVVFGESSSFNFPDGTTTFLSPQSKPMVGWQRTKPSYEEEYTPDAPLTARSAFGEGYTFPCLFKVPFAAPEVKKGKPQPVASAWVLVSETGVGSGYVASHLTDYVAGSGYTIAFPNKDEMQGLGSPWAGMPLPSQTPWRTITVGTSLKPIVETTIPYDVVEPLYEPSQDYKPGRYTWGWLIWQDNSANSKDNRLMVDAAADMGYEYCLIDALWDKSMGHKGIEELAAYAKTRNVRLLLWYNSNGYWNDAPQGPRCKLNTALERNREMAWMQSAGIAGIKVDFFGSDKQEMMKLYEDILADGNRYGLQVIFHGCTLPRGWERMYPNYVASEAALASENVYFSEYHAKKEGFELCMHPFCRNAVGAFDWGGVIMNGHMSRDNKSRHQRHTTDIFEMASGIVLQTSVNCVAVYPNNLLPESEGGMPQFERDFLRSLPTAWDEVQYVDGYPTQFVVLARRTGNRWYVAGLNAGPEARTLKLNVPMFAGHTVKYYIDEAPAKGQTSTTPVLKTLKINKKGEARVTIQPMGGLILCD